MKSNFKIIEDGLMICNHCGELIPTGLMPVVIHLENCEILKEISKDRAKALAEWLKKLDEDE